MGFRGFVRSYNAAVRRSEREQQRQTKEAARQYKQYLKETEISLVADAVSKYEEYLEAILSIHKDCSDYIDWSIIKNEPAPERPLLKTDSESIAQEKFDLYSPSFFDKLLGLTNKKIRKLEDELELAKNQDRIIYENELAEYDKHLLYFEPSGFMQF